MIRFPINSRAKPLRIAVVLVVLTATLAVASAAPAAADSKSDVDVDLVVKAHSRSQAQRAADKVDGEVVGEVLNGRNLYRIRAQLHVKPDEVNKKSAELAKKVGKEKSAIWAAPISSRVDDDRFYAWRFYAWPDGELDDQIDRDDDLSDFLDLETVHKAATGRGATVAILDTGFDADHPLIASQMLPGIDLVDGDNETDDDRNGRDDDRDGSVDEAHGHGTFVAGVVTQIAPEAKILPIRVLDADGVGELYAVIEGIETAVAQGADVINLSFGMPYDSEVLKETLKRADKAGVVVVAAAGNEGSKEKQYPAASKEVLSVAAYDRASGAVASFGSRGKWVDVSAPGVDIVSARPGGGVGTWSGSSLAAPVVAGEVALLTELNPRNAAKEARKIVRESARKARKGVKDDVGVVDVGEAVDRSD